MAIRRTRTNLEDHYTQLDNEWLRDGRLSLKARGLFAQILSHREGWSISIASLERANPEGSSAIRSALNELIEFGYLVRGERERDEAGRLGDYDYTLWGGKGLPAPDVESPTLDNPTLDNPTVDDQTPKKNISKKTISKNIPIVPSDDLFDSIWSVWPKKVAESTARNEWKKIPASERQERSEQLIAHGKAHAQYTPSEYWPRLSAYIRDTRWNQPLPTPRPGTPAAAGVTNPGLTDSQGRPAPFGLTPGGRRLGPPARAGEHPRAPWLGMMLSASTRGMVFVRDRPLQMREATENEKRILNGADD